MALDYAVPDRLLTAKGGGKDLHAEITLPNAADAPVQQGDTLGSWQLLSGGQVVQQLPICAAQDVQALSFGYCFRYLVNNALLGGL